MLPDSISLKAPARGIDPSCSLFCRRKILVLVEPFLIPHSAPPDARTAFILELLVYPAILFMKSGRAGKFGRRLCDLPLPYGPTALIRSPPNPGLLCQDVRQQNAREGRGAKHLEDS